MNTPENVQISDDFYYELYGVLLEQAYNETKRPVNLSQEEAVELALKVTTEERHGKLDEEKLYSIHKEVRERLGIDK